MVMRDAQCARAKDHSHPWACPVTCLLPHTVHQHHHHHSFPPSLPLRPFMSNVKLYVLSLISIFLSIIHDPCPYRTLRPPPNVDFVHGTVVDISLRHISLIKFFFSNVGYPGIPPGPDRQQAAVKGVRLLFFPLVDSSFGFLRL
jgi:hypothetical protein